MTDKITDFSSGKKMADKLTHMKALVIKFSDQFTNGPFYEIKQKIDEALKEIVECLGVDRGVFGRCRKILRICSSVIIMPFPKWRMSK